MTRQLAANLLDQFSDGWLIAAVGAAVAVLIVISAIVQIRRRRPVDTGPSLTINLAAHDLGPPPASGPRLECHNVPVRMAVLVLAPVGRISEVPQGPALGALCEALLPGLANVVAAHKTAIRIWPAQLSPRGFAHSFLANIGLPPEKAKGSPWCAVAGKFDTGSHHYMAGMALRSDLANGLACFTMEKPSDWFDTLRVK